MTHFNHTNWHAKSRWERGRDKKKNRHTIIQSEHGFVHKGNIYIAKNVWPINCDYFLLRSSIHMLLCRGLFFCCCFFAFGKLRYVQWNFWNLSLTSAQQQKQMPTDFQLALSLLTLKVTLFVYQSHEDNSVQFSSNIISDAVVQIKITFSIHFIVQ